MASRIMKRVVVKEPYCVSIEETEIPRPDARELLVRVHLSGISMGTEMHLYRGLHPNLQTKKWGYWTAYPIYPGYEAAGVVVECGSDVESFSPGDRVVCMGAHAEYAKVALAKAARIPDHVSHEEATFAVLATTCMHAIRRARIEYGDVVAVIGAGVVGILAMQHARLSGSGMVIAIDVDEKRLGVATDLGADYALNPQSAEFVARFEGIAPTGCDQVIEAAGQPEAMELALTLARDRGRVIILGYHVEPVSLMLGDDFFHKELEIRASRGIGPEADLPLSCVRWTSAQSFQYAMRLISERRLRLGPILTHSETFPYWKIGEVYEMINQGGHGYLQVFLDWSRTVKHERNSPRKGR